jgi:hypothetical protein
MCIMATRNCARDGHPAPAKGVTQSKPVSTAPGETQKVDAHTPLHMAGNAAIRVVEQATAEIEAMADAMLQHCSERSETHAVLRALASRVKAVNAVLICYYGLDDLYTLEAGFNEVWQGSRYVAEVVR